MSIKYGRELLCTTKQLNKLGQLYSKLEKFFFFQISATAIRIKDFVTKPGGNFE